MLFIKTKTVKDIEARARAKERQKQEVFYTKELEKQRERFIKSLQEQEIHINEKHQENIKQLREKFNKEVMKYRTRMSASQNEIRQWQRAWLILKEFVPRALNSATMLKAEAFIEQQKVSAKLGKREGIADNLESLQRDLIEIGPRIEKLISEKK